MNRKITNKIILIISTFLILSSLLFGNLPSSEDLMEAFKKLMVLSLIYVIIPIIFIIILVIVILSKKIKTTIKLIIVVIIVVSGLFIYRTYASNRDINSLMDATENGYLGEVKELVERKRVNIKDKYVYDALMKAIEYGNSEIVKYLIESGIDINDTDVVGDTALMYASRWRQLEIIKYLIENGADVNAIDINGETALMEASKRGVLEKAIYSIRNGEEAASSISLEIVQYLLENGADINAKDSGGWTALITASSGGNLEIVQYLVEKGADINSKNENDWTALMRASYNGHFEIVELLIGKGANVNIKNNDGKTALDLAKTEEIKEVLRRAGAK